MGSYQNLLIRIKEQNEREEGQKKERNNYVSYISL